MHRCSGGLPVLLCLPQSYDRHAPACAAILLGPLCHSPGGGFCRNCLQFALLSSVCERRVYSTFPAACLNFYTQACDFGYRFFHLASAPLWFTQRFFFLTAKIVRALLGLTRIKKFNSQTSIAVWYAGGWQNCLRRAALRQRTLFCARGH